MENKKTQQTPPPESEGRARPMVLRNNMFPPVVLGAITVAGLLLVVMGIGWVLIMGWMHFFGGGPQTRTIVELRIDCLPERHDACLDELMAQLRDRADQVGVTLSRPEHLSGDLWRMSVLGVVTESFFAPGVAAVHDVTADAVFEVAIAHAIADDARPALVRIRPHSSSRERLEAGGTLRVDDIGIMSDSASDPDGPAYYIQTASATAARDLAAAIQWPDTPLGEHGGILSRARVVDLLYSTH